MSIPPEYHLPPAREFNRRILQLNSMGDAEVHSWSFDEGMAFGSTVIWWGSGGRRPFPHEGVDLSMFLNDRGERLSLTAGTLVPVLYSGVVRTVRTDFVASSIWIKHNEFRTGSWTLHSVYAHVTPAQGLRMGHEITEKEVAGRVAVSSRPSGPPAHIHLSMALVHDKVIDDALDWAVIHDEPGVYLIDPMAVVNPADEMICPQR